MEWNGMAETMRGDRQKHGFPGTIVHKMPYRKQTLFIMSVECMNT